MERRLYQACHHTHPLPKYLESSLGKPCSQNLTLPAQTQKCHQHKLLPLRMPFLNSRNEMNKLPQFWLNWWTRKSCIRSSIVRLRRRFGSSLRLFTREPPFNLCISFRRTTTTWGWERMMIWQHSLAILKCSTIRLKSLVQGLSQKTCSFLKCWAIFLQFTTRSRLCGKPWIPLNRRWSIYRHGFLMRNDPFASAKPKMHIATLLLIIPRASNPRDSLGVIVSILELVGVLVGAPHVLSRHLINEKRGFTKLKRSLQRNKYLIAGSAEKLDIGTKSALILQEDMFQAKAC